MKNVKRNDPVAFSPKKHFEDCPCKKPLEEQVNKVWPYINRAKRLKGSKLKFFLKNINHCILNFISHSCRAVCHGAIELPTSGKKKLRRFKNLLAKLNIKKRSAKKKRSLLLSQKGGGFPFIPILASVLGPLIGRWFGG
jgi:hypothetical protein